MSTAALVGLGLVLWGIGMLVVWALCRAAAKGDQTMEQMAWDANEPEDAREPVA